MKYKEQISWILDDKNSRFTEKEYQKNIDFVHSLGRKCDPVGWSELDLDDPDADAVLLAIERFCKAEGWGARGVYRRSFTDVASDWFRLKKDFFVSDNERKEAPAADGGKVKLTVIRAYHEKKSTPKCAHWVCVPERFRDACIKNGVSGIEFCWVEDKGKYDAEQYFELYTEAAVAHVACNRGLTHKEHMRIKALGGRLPQLAKLFYDLQLIVLEDCYLADDMPSGGMVYVYHEGARNFSGRWDLLIHRDIAEMLLREKVLPPEYLKPAMIVPRCPDGYTLEKTQLLQRPTAEYIGSMLEKYQKLKESPRPKRAITEKQALSLLRRTKSENKDRFAKRLNEQVDTPLMPYYRIANGGCLSDEYELLSYDDSVKATAEFKESIEKEELLETKPSGTVICRCINGDAVLLTDAGKVIRFSHEEPEAVVEWPDLAQFIYDAINEEE